MNSIIKMMINRRTIRKYKPEQISEQELASILDAGLHSPNAGGRQSAITVVCQNNELNEELGKLNRGTYPINSVMGNVSTEQPSIADDGNIKSAFYNAPARLLLQNAVRKYKKYLISAMIMKQEFI